MNVYTVTLMARRDDVLRIRPGIVLGAFEEDAHAQGMAAALVALPADDGWTDHQVILAEVPNQMDLGSYVLTWQVAS